MVTPKVRLRCLVWAGIVGSSVALVAFGGAAPTALAETRGYVISMIHTATYANADTCPAGGNGGTVEIRTRRLLGAGFDEEAALRIIGNGGRDDDGNRVDITRLHGSSAAAGGQPWNGQPVSPGNVPALSADPEEILHSAVDGRQALQVGGRLKRRIWRSRSRVG